MKNILFYILVFINYLSFGQIKDSLPVFEYEINYSLGVALVKKGYVFKKNEKVHFNATKSIFLKDLPKFVEKNEEGIPEINIMAKGVVNENIITDIEKDSLFSLGSAASTPLLVKEKLVKQKWLATGVNKKIGSRICHEFKTTFRGRFYTAFVDLSVPFFYGPWKFNNQPGLLVSVEDRRKQLSWKLLSVKYYPLKKINKLIADQEKHLDNFNSILLEDFVPLLDASFGGTVSISSSRLPRGYKKKKSTTKWKRTGRELIYEWEE